VTESTYTGTVLELRTDKPSSPDFYFIRAFANGQQTFGVKGDGQVEFEVFTANKAQLTGGATISGGGITVPDFGVTIEDGGLSIINGGARLFSTENLVNTHIKSTVAAAGNTDGFTSELLRIEAEQGFGSSSTTTNFYF